MSDVGVANKANGSWTLTIIASILAMSGWGALAYQARSSAAAQQHLQQRGIELAATRDQRTAERDELKIELDAVGAELTAVRRTLGQVTAQRDEVKAQLAAARQEIATIQSRLGEAQVTGSVRSPAKPAPAPAQAKRNTR